MMTLTRWPAPGGEGAEEEGRDQVPQIIRIRFRFCGRTRSYDFTHKKYESTNSSG